MIDEAWGLTDYYFIQLKVHDMGILSFLRKPRLVLPRVQHPIFGLMEATLQNDDGSFFWETPGTMQTPKGEISVFLDGPVTGPSQEQVALWDWIYANSENLVHLAEPHLLQTLADFGLERHLDDLCWSAVGLSTDGSRESPWDMSFALPISGSKFDGAILTVCFAAGAPTGIVNFDN